MFASPGGAEFGVGERIRIGTAGWSVPAAHRGRFPEAGTLLERYAARFDAVEINSSFYRPHRPSTYARWAASVPAGFRFSLKLPREITHTRRLVEVAEPLDRFLGEVAALGERLGPVLVQLPPKFRLRARDRRRVSRQAAREHCRRYRVRAASCRLVHG